MGKGRIAELDGLRAFAVLGVVLYHVVLFSGKVPPVGPISRDLILALGIHGVDVFFVISGFVITTLVRREQAENGEVNLRAFYRRRFFRLLPALLVYVGAIALLRGAGAIRTPWSAFGYALLGLGNFGVFDGRSWLLGHTWSLAVEEQFYLVFPPLLARLFRFNKRWATGALLGIFCLLAAGAPFDIHARETPTTALDAVLGGVTHFRFLIVGALLGLHRDHAERLLAGTSPALPLLAAAGLLVSALVHTPLRCIAVLASAVEPWLCGALVLWLPTNPDRSTVLRTRPVQAIGLGSYSIYLWQQLFTGNLGAHRASLLNSLPVSILGLAVCAGLSYWFVERAGIRLGRTLGYSPSGAKRSTVLPPSTSAT